jgi:hypothetical protein
MSTNENATRKTRSWKRWITSGFAVLCGLVYVVGGWYRGDRAFALG